jgi:hypothetical protein
LGGGSQYRTIARMRERPALGRTQVTVLREQKRCTHEESETRLSMLLLLLSGGANNEAQAAWGWGSGGG